MKKWYQHCGWILVAALAVQLTGCAQQSSWLSRLSWRDRGDQKLVEVDDKAKTKTASTKKSTAEKSKDSKDKPKESLFAKKSSTKSKAPEKAKTTEKESTRTEVASSKETTAPTKSPKKTLDPFLNEELEALASTGTTAKKKADAKIEAASKAIRDIDPFEEHESDAEIAQTSAEGAQKPASKQSSIIEHGSRIQEATHKVEDNLADLGDLPEWALDEAVTQTKTGIKKATKAASTEIKTASANVDEIARDADQVRKELEETLKEPAPASPASAVKSTGAALLALCPAAEGELREQIRSLNSNDVESLKRGVHRIGRMGTDAAAAAPALENLLKHKDGFVRTHAALALARMQKSPPEAVQTVVEGLKSSDPGLRSFAAAALAEMGPQAGEALTVLAESLDDRDGYVRLHAAEVLIRYDEWSYRALETLLGCLSDKDENVRWLATYSLAELAPEAPEAVTALAKATRDPVLKVQTGAVYALGEIGPFAKNAGKALHRLADETNQAELQSAIVYALQQIEQ